MKSPDRRAVLYRMATPEHLCPYGLKALQLLKAKGFAVEGHLLRTRAEIDAPRRRRAC